MPVDGVLADEEPLRNRLIVQASRNQPKNLDLSWRQAFPVVGPGRRRCRARCQGIEHRVGASDLQTGAERCRISCSWPCSWWCSGRCCGCSAWCSTRSSAAPSRSAGSMPSGRSRPTRSSASPSSPSALIVAYPYIPGSESDAFKGVSLFIGIVFSLGSSSAISNIIAGYMMTYRRAFKVGDRVKIGDVDRRRDRDRGSRSRICSRSRTKRSSSPTRRSSAGEVINYSSLARKQGLILHTEVGIGYETPWRQVEAMLLDGGGRARLVLARPPAPFVLQSSSSATSPSPTS